mgnify:CR=1 FL=1
MGSVWLSEDLTLKRTVAVKLIQLASQADEKAQARFTREAQAAAGLVHPNIVTVHDFGVDDGIAFMVMEHLPGPDLATLVRRSGPLPLDQALDYLEQAAAGLAAAHARGILHRDVKPANLMLTSFGTLKMLDFGIAALADHSQNLTATSQLIGTLSYLAPERSMGSPASVQSDLYALGCVAVTLLTGKPPFEGTTGQILLKHINEPPARLSLSRPDLPAELDGLIDNLLAKDPALRPRSAEDVIDTLRAIHRGLAPIDPAEAGLSAPLHVASTKSVPVPVGDTVRRADRVPGWAESTSPVVPGDAQSRVAVDHPRGTAGEYTAPPSTDESLATVLRPGKQEATVGRAISTEPPSGHTGRPHERDKKLEMVGGPTLVGPASTPMASGGRSAQLSPPDSASPQEPNDGTVAQSAARPSPATGPLPLENSSIHRTRGRLAVAAVATVGLVAIAGVIWGANRTESGASPVVAAAASSSSAPSAPSTPGATPSSETIRGQLATLSSMKLGGSIGDIAVDLDRGLIYGADTENRMIRVADLSNGRSVAKIKVSDLRSPYGVGYAADTILMPNSYSNKLTVIDAESRKVRARVAVGTTPLDAEPDAGATVAVVPNSESGTVSLIDLSRAKVVATLRVGEQPWKVTVASSLGLAFVTNSSGSVSVISIPDRRVIGTIEVGQDPYATQVDQDAGLAYTSNQASGSVSVIDVAGRAVKATIKGLDSPAGMAIDPAAHLLFVNTGGGVAVIDTETRKVLSRTKVKADWGEIQVDPGKHLLYVLDMFTDNVTVLRYTP